MLSGCSGLSPAPTPSPEPTYDVTGDGVLTIGTLFDGAAGAAQVAGVEIAVRDVNLAGGYAGTPVVVLHRAGADGFASLVERGADVVIGSSAEVLVPLAEESGVPVIVTEEPLGSGTSDLAVSVAPTAASVPLALATSLAAAGVTTVGLVDGDGSLEKPLAAALEDAGLELTATVPLAADPAVTLAGLGAASAVVLSAPSSLDAETGALIPALADAGRAGPALWLAGDAARAWGSDVPAGALTDSWGIRSGAPVDAAFVDLLHQSDPGLSSTRFANEAYDAVVLAALAAVLADDDGGPAIARQLRAASSGGIHCSSFGECVDVLASETDVDYRGKSGDMTLDDAGDNSATGTTLVRYTSKNSAKTVTP